MFLGSGAVSEADPGQQEYITAGTYSWTVPPGVSSVSVVCIGGGGFGSTIYSSGGVNGLNNGAGGGACAYKNNISVTSGASITVVVGDGPAPSDNTSGGDSSFMNTSTVKAAGGQSPNPTDGGKDGGQTSDCVGDGSYKGGDGGVNAQGGQGGDGSTSGGNVGTAGNDGAAGGSGGNGGGGGGGGSYAGNTPVSSGGGASNNGAFIGAGGGGGGGERTSNTYGAAGGGGGNIGTVTGSSATSGNSRFSNWYGGGGGRWGGGGGSSRGHSGPYSHSLSKGGDGAVRIIWGNSDTTRTFPSTNVGDV